MTHAETDPDPDLAFTPAERAFIRDELDRVFSTLPTVAEGIWLRTWVGGPRAGQPKVPLGARACWHVQDADTGNRSPLAEQRWCIVEQTQMRELPIEGPIAWVAVEADRHRLILIRRRGNRIAVAAMVVSR